MDYLRGGRGNHAPYSTTHVRIPEPIKSLVQDAAQYYRQNGCVPTLNMVTSLDEVDDDEQDDDNRSDPSDLETIQAQAQIIQAYLSEINYLKTKLNQVDSQVTLSNALEQAKWLVKQKKSAVHSVSLLLAFIYHVDLMPSHLK
jgi:hypothetical protein